MNDRRDEKSYRDARIVAAQRNATHSALVREYLSSSIPSQAPDTRTAQLLEALDKAGKYRAADRLTRKESHRR